MNRGREMTECEKGFWGSLVWAAIFMLAGYFGDRFFLAGAVALLIRAMACDLVNRAVKDIKNGGIK